MNQLILFIIGLFFLSNCYSQNDSSSSLNGGLGYMARTTVLYYKNMGSGGYFVGPYSYAKGVNGTGMIFYLNYSFKTFFAFKYEPTIRYDFFYFDRPKNRHTFYFDHNFSLTTQVFSPKTYFGAGYSIINVNKSLKYDDNGDEEELPLEFDALNFIFGVKIKKKFIAEFTWHYIRDDFPDNPYRNVNMIRISVLYRLLRFP